MKKTVLAVCLFFTVVIGISSLEISPALGFSALNYAEFGVNNKDDLYKIDCFVAGVDIGQQVWILDLVFSANVQIPVNLTITDALGSDSENYLNYLTFFGGNFRAGVFLPIQITEKIELSPGGIGNYDLIYLEDYNEGYDEVYYYSVIGAGAELNFKVELNDNADFVLSGAYVYNFLPVGFEREGDFLWSWNLLFTAGVEISF